MKCMLIRSQSKSDDSDPYIGVYDFAQIPAVGEKIVKRDGGDLIFLPVLEVHHLIGTSGSKSAFVLVGTPSPYAIDNDLLKEFAE